MVRLIVSSSSLAVDRDSGTLYATDIGSDELLTINRTTGAASSVGSLGADFETVSGLAFDANNDVLYGADSFDGGLLTINTATGAGSLVGSIAASAVSSLAYHHATDTLYGSNAASTLFTITPTMPTPTATPIGAGIGIAPIDGLTAIPEPSSVLFLSMVFSFYCFWGRELSCAVHFLCFFLSFSLLGGCFLHSLVSELLAKDIFDLVFNVLVSHISGCFVFVLRCSNCFVIT